MNKNNKNWWAKQSHLSLKFMLPQRYDVLSLILNLAKVTELASRLRFLTPSVDVFSTTSCALLCGFSLFYCVLYKNRKKLVKSLLFMKHFQVYVIKQPCILPVSRLNNLVVNLLTFTYPSLFQLSNIFAYPFKFCTSHYEVR